MAKSVEQIRAQIAKLREREKALLQKEAVGVIARIREAIEHYGITPDQIFGEADVSAKAPRSTKRGAAASSTGQVRKTRGVKVARQSSPVKGTKVAVKYRDEAGNTWTGRGSQPRWIRAALETGKRLEDFLIS